MATHTRDCIQRAERAQSTSRLWCCTCGFAKMQMAEHSPNDVCPCSICVAWRAAKHRDEDPTRRPIVAEKYVNAGKTLSDKRKAVGWSRRYAAARLTLPEADLAQFESGFPIRYGQFQRLMRVYNRTLWKLTHGYARSTKPGRYQ